MEEELGNILKEKDAILNSYSKKNKAKEENNSEEAKQINEEISIS